MTDKGVKSWSTQYSRRKAIAGRLGDIFSLPLAKRPREILLDEVDHGAAVLEVGAGDRRMQTLLAGKRGEIAYRSLDIDPEGDHDYHDWSQVDKKFDVVFAFEVVEHVPTADLPGLLAEMAARLNPGGRLILSTPNIYYPPAYLRDVTHCTPLCFDELGGLVESTGLTVDRIVRIYNDPLHRKIIRRGIFGWLFRMLGIDFARQIVLVARNSAETATSRIAA